MHQILYGIREIPPDQLPTVSDVETGEHRPATDEELLQFGFHRLDGDLFSVAEQYRGDVVELEGRPVRVWRHHDDTPAPTSEAELQPRTVEEAAALRPHGELLAHGALRERYAKLPADKRARVMDAELVRATDPDVSAAEIAKESLIEQLAAIEEHVGDIVEGETTRPLVDFWDPQSLASEAARLADRPDSGLERIRRRMHEVDVMTDVVLTDNLVPHSWAGEQ